MEEIFRRIFGGGQMIQVGVGVTRNEEIEIDVMAKAAQLYALMVLDICRSRKRPPPA